jgi:membrane-bound metal-dependent hydrolase YbcI (DUF457 family)
MFIGHYGPSFAAKAVKNSIPLWVLFLAVQLLDVFWSVFVLLGIEKVHIVPGITATNPLDLYYMPYTHSLIAAIFWAIAAGLIYWLCRRTDGLSAAGLVSGAVFSHWILDLLVHRPDLPLFGNTLKVGFGLWNYPALAFALEVGFLFGGMYLYLRATKAKTRGGSYGMVVLGLIVVVVQAVVFFGPPPTSDRAGAITAFALYIVLAAVAYWLEEKRAPRNAYQKDLTWKPAN